MVAQIFQRVCMSDSSGYKLKISSKSDVRLPRYCKFSSGVFFLPPPWFFTCGKNLVPMSVNPDNQGLPEPSSLRGSTLGTRAAEHKGCNWGMQID